MDREVWHATVQGATKSRHDSATEQQQQCDDIKYIYIVK